MLYRWLVEDKNFKKAQDAKAKDNLTYFTLRTLTVNNIYIYIYRTNHLTSVCLTFPQPASSYTRMVRIPYVTPSIWKRFQIIQNKESDLMAP
jgi:hypothetical protein